MKQSFGDSWLHVTNVFQWTIASFLFTILKHNDRLKCDPPLIAHFDC
jgi:hypothetical protein